MFVVLQTRMTMKSKVPPFLVCASLLVAATPDAPAQTSFTVGANTVNVVEIATGLEVPWDMNLGPDGWIWFTQANGQVYRLHPDEGTLELVHTVADVVVSGFTAGLHSMAFHPDFATEPYVYLHYMISTDESVVKRFLYDVGSNSFTTVSPHLLSVTIPGYASHNGSRLIADDLGNFILTMGDHMSGSALVQDMNAIEGKFLRFDPLGGIPSDNPIPGSYVFNWGHRNPQGLVKAANGIWYNSAHGAGLDDEVNLVLPNRNYGWPVVAGLCNTATEIAYCDENDVVEPIHQFNEVVAPSGMDYFDHPALPGWQNSLLVATLRGRELHQLQLNPAGDQVVSEQIYLTGTYRRLRDVLVHPDGRIFISTSNHDSSGTPGPTDDRILALVSDAIHTGVSPTSVPGISIWFDQQTRSLRLTGTTNGSSLVSVVDASGRTLFTTRSNNGWTYLPSLAPGVYHARVSGTQGIGSATFVIR